MPKPRSPGALRLLAFNGAIDSDVAAQEAVDRAWSLRFDDARGMLEWAELATELATSEGMRAVAYAHLGNAHRVNGRLREADEFLDLAEKLQSEPDLLLLEFRVSLYENQGLFEEAAYCLDATGRLRAASHGKDSEAKFLTLTGRVLAEAGRHARAAEVFREALEVLESDEDIARCAVHGLAHSLASSGRPAKGLQILQEGQSLLEKGDLLFRLRVSWLLGRIGMLCGADDVAVANLEEAREGFSRAGLTFETCQVTLDRAVHEARRDRIGEAIRLLEPIPELLTEIGVEAHAKTAAAVRLLLLGRVSQALEALAEVISAVQA